MYKYNIEKHFGNIETKREYNGYFYSITDAIEIAILGTFCGLGDMKQIIQWAKDERVRTFLREHFAIYEVPCYSWFTQILGNINPDSFNVCFTKWIVSIIGELSGKTLSLDGKTVCSTAKMKNYRNPLHIISAQLAEFGITIGQKAVDGKSNEIPTVRELLEMLDIKGCMIVADAVNCQKETVKLIIKREADYLLPVKGNHSTLETDIADYIADDDLRKGMDTVTKVEKNRSSKPLTAQKLLDYARKEWSVESMHYLLDMRFSEDSFRAAEQRTQETINIIRKIVLNLIRIYKNENNQISLFQSTFRLFA